MAMDGYEAIWRKIDQWNGTASFTTWCYRIIANKVLDFYRSNGENYYEPLPIDTLDLPGLNEERLCTPLELCRRAWPCWKQLKEETKSSSHWHLKLWFQIDVCELPRESVAERWNTSVSNVNVIAHRIRGILKQCLSNSGYDNSFDLLRYD